MSPRKINLASFMRSYTFQTTRFVSIVVNILIPNISIGIEDKPVQFISVNNAVLICEDCAKLHRELSSGISYVMSIADAGERYSPHKVELLKFGGNERFKNFFSAYWHPETGDPIFPPGYPLRDKYVSNAGKYYRHKIQ